MPTRSLAYRTFVPLAVLLTVVVATPGLAAVCGNGTREGGEQCDDGNVASGDGCSAACLLECASLSGTWHATLLNGAPGGDRDWGIRDDGAGNLLVNTGTPEAGALTGTRTPVSQVVTHVTLLLDGQPFQSGEASCTQIALTEGPFFFQFQLDKIADSYCGDGTVDPGEECDDGNFANDDTCTATCIAAACGNHVVEAPEECDDGNTLNGDGCSTTCEVNVCGNGAIEPGEQCDDGNTTNNDGCTALCQSQGCGDGAVQLGEQCDDGNTLAGDGCSPACLEECPSLTGTWWAESDAPGAIDTMWEIVEDVAGNLSASEGTSTFSGARVPGVRSAVTFETTSGPSFTFSGEMTSCDEVALSVLPTPFAITLRRYVEPPNCGSSLHLADAEVSLSNLGAETGEQRLTAKGRLVLPPGGSFDPTASGVQVLVEDLGGAWRTFDVTYRARPVPPLAADPCVAPGEGWRRDSYRSVARPLDPPQCILGTAYDMVLRLRDRRTRGGDVAFTLRAKRARVVRPEGSVRITLALGTNRDALVAASCGNARPVLTCTSAGNAKRLRCR